MTVLAKSEKKTSCSKKFLGWEEPAICPFVKRILKDFLQKKTIKENRESIKKLTPILLSSLFMVFKTAKMVRRLASF